MVTLQVELWQGVSLVISILGGIALLGKIALNQISRGEDARHGALAVQITGIEGAMREETAQWQRLERELLSLKADLPLNYVRRDDFIRVQSIIESKLDGLALRIENASLKRRAHDD